MNLRITPEDGLTIVVPRRFPMRDLPGILAEKQEWIRKSLQWADAERRLRRQEPPPVIPSHIDLPACGESWLLERRPTAAGSVRVLQHGFRKLRVCGKVYDTALVSAALRRWLSRRTRQTLVPRLDRLAARHGFDTVRKTSVRNQQTCWASYSPSGSISLNLKLLFLPPHLVDYVLIHELCHSVHLDHSGRFWSLVGRCDPDFQRNRRELAAVREEVPRWIAR